MKIVYKPFLRTLEEQIYLDSVVEKMKRERVVRPPSTVQAKSTQATLDRDPHLDKAHQNRPLPTFAQALAVKDAIRPDGTIDWDKAVGARKLDPIEISHFEATRKRPKNSQGQSELSSVSPARRESGIQALLYTPPAKVTKKDVETKAVNLVQYKSEPLIEEWRPLTWYQAITHWFSGKKVRQEITDTKRTWVDEVLPDPGVQGDPKGMAKKT